MTVTEDQAAAVLKAMAEEGASLRRACKAAGCATTTFWDWAQRKENRERYARARDAQIEYWVDELIDMSDDNSRDIRVNPDGTTSVDHETVARARLRSDNRKWVVSKLRPDKYGERVTADVNVRTYEQLVNASLPPLPKPDDPS